MEKSIRRLSEVIKDDQSVMDVYSIHDDLSNKHLEAIAGTIGMDGMLAFLLVLKSLNSPLEH